MSLRNRVDPFGEFHAVPARGGLMGNRGVLHDGEKTVRKTHAHRNWVACALDYRGRRREIMAPGRYTELFFLDEATALAAGHRPCGECRRERYRVFVACWEAVYGGAAEGLSMPRTIDGVLHRARITRAREQVVHAAEAEGLPDGTMVAVGAEALLLWRGRALRWSFGGYGDGRAVPRGRVTVLTPAPVVAVLRAGYRPEVHGSAVG
ncbi:hypothetical protein [Histidinibacterium lentulum]|uniref:Metal-binding protein n=1 Tax=Histidinibacterium lentulum TaxID=2480588 RepID=A0A3N2QR86_9RHOB|nr:hypothetical protein [Histidinibacterium lentulum]ROT97722.1 hypothetical protein EAT49_18110 [Histidinibacterium lentulum]